MLDNAEIATPDVEAVESIAPQARTLVEAFVNTAAGRGDNRALRAAVNAPWTSWQQYADQSERAARALAALGVTRGDTVALMLRNRPEFHFLDTAALQLGAIPFSIYNTSAAEQIAELLADSGAKLVVTEAAFAANVLAGEVEGVRVFSVDGVTSADVEEWEDALALANPGFDLLGARASVSGDDIATIIYTSGTTGPPKGVQLTHANIIWMARVLPVWWRMTTGEESLVSYLPMAHIAERVLSQYLPMLWGWPVTCCDDPRTVGSVLPAAEPSLFFAPPRFWEKLRAAALAGPLASAESQRLLEAGLEHVRAQQAGEPPAADAADLREAFAPLRTAFGLAKLSCAMISAATVPPPLIEFWRAVGVPMVEGYGLSEATAGVCFDDPLAPRIGTVGPPLPGVEVRLAPDNELLVRSPSVMVGYRGRPQQTAEALDAEGWLHTGDIARIDDDRRLRIVDRKKEIIVSSAGKNMSPANIEAKLKSASSLIAQTVCIGDGRPYNVALIVLDPEAAASPLSEAAADERILTEVGQAVERANAQLSRVEQIKRFAVLPVDWLPDGDELTPTMKLKRRAIAAKYAAQIEALYA
jgi:long-chain acyl-CoA synthetase